ncbi:MAG: helix-turn-helix domain-containing protein [Agathobacter sp.]|nr:helix-turn-helix domain-containing protein [Agathobacter sp.]
MTLGTKIAELRKEKGMTQEALANELGVSNQAVSKWEANQSCPDIQLLPQIADIFGITLDDLFGREIEQEEPIVTCENHRTGETENVEARGNYDVPWEEDGKLRAVVYIGRKLVQAQDCTQASEITFTYEGAALDIISSFSVTCDAVEGNVTANGSVTCDNVEGNVNAKGSVTCDAVEGNIQAMGSVTCDVVEGNVDAGGNVTCDEINGNASAGGNIICDGY